MIICVSSAAHLIEIACPQTPLPHLYSRSLIWSPLGHVAYTRPAGAIVPVGKQSERGDSGGLKPSFTSADRSVASLVPRGNLCLTISVNCSFVAFLLVAFDGVSKPNGGLVFPKSALSRTQPKNMVAEGFTKRRTTAAAASDESKPNAKRPAHRKSRPMLRPHMPIHSPLARGQVPVENILIRCQ